ncbi:hypothetical protein Ancab_024668 [Ancistrocladus abbreviatus]
MTTVRRAKWHPPPRPPTPRILHLPRPNRRKQPTKNVAGKPISSTDPVVRRSPKGKLECLFDQERKFSYSTRPPIVLLNSSVERDRRRRAVEESDDKEVVEAVERENERGGGILEEEKWRFQAEILRAECKFLRMEREIAVKKLERERAFVETTLKSAAHTLISGKKKIREGKSMNAVLVEEIEELAKMLVELQRSSRLRDLELQNCSNFDKQASLLQKKLKKLGALAHQKCTKAIQEMPGVSLSMQDAEDGIPGDFASHHNCSKFADVETLRRKMEGLSKGKLLKKMEEEYQSMLAATANCSAASSACSFQRYELSDLPSSALRLSLQETKSGELKMCAGHCKAIVRRIVEQVRAETEQWSQMQEMLGQVKEEMEELQASRDFWEHQALHSDQKIHSLCSSVEQWKLKALSLVMKENQLQKQVRMLQEELERLRVEQGSEIKQSKELATVSCQTSSPHEMEKRVLTCRVKGNNQTSGNSIKTKDGGTDGNTLQRSSNRLASPNRLPFQDIGNLSPLLRQSSNRSVPLCGPQHDHVDGSF